MKDMFEANPACIFSIEESTVFWQKLKTNDSGLIVAIIIDADSHEVLMQAFQDEEAFAKTLSTGLMHYHSRSRQKLWLKGETSGHFQYVQAIKVDCDADCLSYSVKQKGVACHTGAPSCFYRKVSEL